MKAFWKKPIDKGAFIEKGGKIYYVDGHGKAWSEDNIADLVKSFRAYLNHVQTVHHYQKHLR